MGLQIFSEQTGDHEEQTEDHESHACDLPV
jgi:hypothetical protein